MISMLKTMRLLLRGWWQQFRWLVPLLIALTIISSLLEGLAVSMLLPLLAALGITEGSSTQMLIFTRIFESIGLDVTLASVITLMICMFVLQYSTILMQSWLAASIQSAYLKSQREDTFRRMMEASWSFLAKSPVGWLINGVVSETSRAASAVYVVVQLISALTTTIIFVTIALLLSWHLTLLLILAATLVAALLHPILRWSRELGTETSVQYARSMAWLNEVFNGTKLIKATSAEDFVAHKHNEIEKELARIQRSMSFQPQLLRIVFEASGIIFLLITLTLATSTFGLEGGVVITVVALFLRLYPRLGNLQHLVQQLFQTLPAVENLKRIIAMVDQAHETVGQPNRLISSGDIRISNLHLSYNKQPVLQGINLHVMPGEHCAFVGASGAGKTSLVDCLLGLTNSTDGEISINGVPIAELGHTNWRRSVGYVTQETILFNMSIRENIVWNSSCLDEAAIETAARLANAHDFVMATPNGYDTVVGDRGVMLSGGQRQRIGLARALLGNRSLVILDEATSALDGEAEAEILKSIKSLRNLTVIMIAHRLSSLRDCDRIFVFEKGQIIEQGNWTQLANLKGRFSAMLETQAIT